MKEDINLEEEVIKDQARNHLIAYSCYTNPDYDPQWFHYTIGNMLMRVANGEITRLIINIPPQNGKSQLTSIDFCSYMLSINPKIRIQNFGYSAELQQYFSKKAREKILSKENQSLFDVQLATEGMKHWDTTEGGYYHAAGVGGAATGFGMDIGLIDDPFKNREEAESELNRNKVWDWFTSTFFTRQGKDAAIILIMTRWHIDDLAGRLLKLEQEGGEKRHKIIIPAVIKGKPIRPERYPIPVLNNIRDTLGGRDWQALYMQNPILSTGSIFKPYMFKYFYESDFEKADGILKKDDLEMFVVCDPAFSTSDLSDDAAIHVLGKHKISGNIYRFESRTDTSAPSETRRMLFRLAEKWESKGYPKPIISIESVQINKDQMKFIKDFKQDMLETQNYYKLIEYKPIGDKKYRIKSTLEPSFDVGRIYFMKGQDKKELDKLENQLLSFPNCEKFDSIDCLNQGVEVADKKHIQKKDKKGVRKIIDPITGKERYVAS